MLKKLDTNMYSFAEDSKKSLKHKKIVMPNTLKDYKEYGGLNWSRIDQKSAQRLFGNFKIYSLRVGQRSIYKPVSYTHLTLPTN